MEDVYLQELSDDDDNDQQAALDKCLRPFDLDRLLGSLFEFIKVHLKLFPKQELSKK